MKATAYAEDHRCEWEGCDNLSPTSRTCRPSCRAKLWKVENDYKEARRVRNASQRPQRRRETRYAICEVEGATIHVLGFEAARDKRTVERLFGLDQVVGLDVVAAAHLPVAA